MTLSLFEMIRTLNVIKTEKLEGCFFTRSPHLYNYMRVQFNPIDTDTEGVIRRAGINGVSVLRGSWN